LVTAERWGQPIRSVVATLASLLRVHCSDFDLVVGRWMGAPVPKTEGVVRDPDRLRLAWWLVNAWLVAARYARPGNLRVGIGSFLGGPSDLIDEILEPGADDAVLELRDLATDTDLVHILPYALDPHGLATRRALLRDPSVHGARRTKKALGIVYTPADVAEYMVREALRDTPDPKVLDPACGTGVYLVAALDILRARLAEPGVQIATRRLRGIDISALALDSCAFVLLHRCIEELRHGSAPPVVAWRSIRSQLVWADALAVPAASDLLGPDAAVNVCVTNPPYAPLGGRADLPALRRRFACLAEACTPTTDMYLPFVESCWRAVARSGGKASVVVPLSLSFGQSVQHRSLRHVIGGSGGSWAFSFYDRTPDALFGDDVKQRTCIAVVDTRPVDGRTVICTSGLRRWTSRNRKSLFATLATARVDASSIVAVLPKLETEQEATAYASLRREPFTLPAVGIQMTSKSPSAMRDGDGSVILVGATAYNWFPVARSLPAGLEDRVTSASMPHRLRAPSPRLAGAVFALLASRLVYWLWRVECDGFHVPAWFIRQLPCRPSLFDGERLMSLSRAGDALWEKLSRNPVWARNRSKLSLSFRPSGCGHILNAIDGALCDTFGLSAAFPDWLEAYVARTVLVDATDVRRSQLKCLREVLT